MPRPTASEIWRTECEAINQEMERLILSEWPRPQEEKQVRKIQFMALVERRSEAARRFLSDAVVRPSRQLRPNEWIYVRGQPTSDRALLKALIRSDGPKRPTRKPLGKRGGNRRLAAAGDHSRRRLYPLCPPPPEGSDIPDELKVKLFRAARGVTNDIDPCALSAIGGRNATLD